jgi:hypothetical protein
VSLGVPAIADRGHTLHDRCEEGVLDATSRFDAIATSRYPCVRAEIRLVRTESGAKLGSRAVVEFNLQVQDAFSVQVTNFVLILMGDLQMVQPVHSDTVSPAVAVAPATAAPAAATDVPGWQPAH